VTRTPLVQVGSLNPAKVTPVRDVFAAYWPQAVVEGVAVPSGVPDQPLGEAQTRQGAVNRARGALAHAGAANAWGVGLEGGVILDGQDGRLFGVVAVAHARAGRVEVEVSRTADLRLPPRVAARVRAGEELGPVMDDLLGLRDIKRGVGSVGVLTAGLLTRADVWRQAVVLALTPLREQALYAEAMTGDIQVSQNEAASRYEITQGGRVLGFAEYRPAGEALLFSHTEIEEGHEGQGLGSRLVQGALDNARAQGRQVVPMCPFVAAFMREHREYADLVQPGQRAVFGL